MDIQVKQLLLLLLDKRHEQEGLSDRYYYYYVFRKFKQLRENLISNTISRFFLFVLFVSSRTHNRRARMPGHNKRTSPVRTPMISSNSSNSS